MSSDKIDDHDVFALSFGAGPRTLLAQGGWIGSSEVWLATLELLSQRWRTMAFDHRGTGERRGCLWAKSNYLAIADAYTNSR